MTTPTVHETTITREGARIMPKQTYTTTHGERVVIVGAANDPARVRVRPCDPAGEPIPGTECFTPRLADLTANR